MTSVTVVDSVVSREAAPPVIADPRQAHAATSLPAFALLLIQLAALAAVFRAFAIEGRSFNLVVALSFGGFAFHYWLPFRYKEWFWVGLSLAGAYVVLEPRLASLLIAVAIAIYVIATARLPFRARIVMLIGLGGLLAWGRAVLAFGLPNHFWQVLGAIFMFRLVVYLYDIRHSTTPPTLREFLAYFLVLPNYHFLLFPVIDYQTMRKTYYQRDIHLIVQQGIGWILRGTMQLVLYRAIYYLKPASNPEQVTSFATLVSLMVLTYLLYLRVSGHFHIVIGLLHLFGYDLPETHRRYLLARTLTDFWRRINIYWKDFMVKLVYFPVYFRLRRSGERRAQIIATTLVFLVTWLLHSYQWFWLRGTWLFTWNDTLFWAILGGLVIVNMLMERRRKVTAVPGWRGRAVAALQTAGTFCLIVVLWSFWNESSIEAWLDLVTWRQVG